MTVWSTLKRFVGGTSVREAGPRGLTLKLLPETAVFRRECEPNISAYLKNDGKRTLRLVMPGDGSIYGWRTPVIKWTSTPWDGSTDPIGRGCGNINGISSGEVFTLEPGESRHLNRWILPTFFPGSATFRAAITYSNEPKLVWRGHPSPPHDQAELELVGKSDWCRVWSNEINISFEAEYPGDAQRAWYPEMVTTLQERWCDGISCDQLLALRTEIQRQLGAIRADRKIKPGHYWLPVEPRKFNSTSPVIRMPQYCVEPEISVWAMIFAFGRFQIANAQQVSDLEERWRSFRREHRLDIDGK